MENSQLKDLQEEVSEATKQYILGQSENPVDMLNSHCQFA